MKLKLGKNQKTIFVLVGLSTTFFYYANQFIERGGNFSDGILAGFLLGLTFVCSVSMFYLWGKILHSNHKVRQ